MMRRLALLLLLAMRALSQDASKLISEIAALQSSASVQHARIGFEFVDMESGKVMAQNDAMTFFTPASNTKLYTTALALLRLGPDYQFHTEVRTPGVWSAGQSVLFSLRLVGGGDPNLSGRVLPYAVHSVDTDPLGAWKELVAKLAGAGIRAVDGDVTGVSTRYAGDLYPDGWTMDDSIYGYGSPVTALALNDNAVSVSVLPTSESELAAVILQPVTSNMVVLNEVITRAAKNTDVHVTRRAGSNELVLWGTIGNSSMAWKEDVAVYDPALFAAATFIDALREQGITIRGMARSQYIAASGDASTPAESGTVLAVHASAPLWQDLEVVNKVSQNLHAEMLLREVGHVCRGAGTLEAGAAEREAFLKAIGITHEETGFALDDGSGLARQDLTTPASTVALLQYMWHTPQRDVWLRTMPVGGVDGSLEHRFHKVRGAERIHAKTGSISHVDTLSGYIETNRHRWIAFSMMVNGAAGPEAEVRNFMDRLCALFLNE